MSTPSTFSTDPAPAWWEDAVIYQIYPRSFASDRAELGTIRGVINRLDYLLDLGVDAIWLSPFYPSPQRDAGYDVKDYCDVDPQLGTLEDAQDLIDGAHERSIRVIIDLVPNHTSDQHQAFRFALEAGPHSPEREWYWFRDTPQDSLEPPNNWPCIFGGAAWTRVRDREDAPGSSWSQDQQWYLHLFDSSQPDLNWDSEAVRSYFDQVLHFWLDRGVDGFRVDVAHGLVKDPQLPNWNGDLKMIGADSDPTPMFNQAGVHDIYRRWNAILAQYPGDRMMVAEAWVEPESELAKYVREDEMHQAFNFAFLCTPWQADALRSTISETLSAFAEVGRPATWVLSNHDVVRHASRLGLAETGKGPNGISAADPQPNVALGARRARAATQLMLSLPGSAYLYQGEELGLPEHTYLPDSVRQDPAFHRTGGEETGRDGCRIPLPWDSAAPGCGFSPTGETWLPLPDGWADYAVDRQLSDRDSSLWFYRRCLQLRRELSLGRAPIEFVELADDALAFTANTPSGPILCVTAFDTEVALPSGWEPLLVSVPNSLSRDEVGQSHLHTDATAWLRSGAEIR